MEPNLVNGYNMGPFVCACFLINLWHAVRSHMTRSKVTRAQIVRLAEDAKFTSFEKLEYDWNQTLFIDIM